MHKRKHSLETRNLFIPVQLEAPDFKTSRLTPKIDNSKTSRKFTCTKENQKPIHQFRWVIDKSLNNKYKQQNTLSASLISIRKLFNLKASETQKLVQKISKLKETKNQVKKDIFIFRESANELKAKIAKTEELIEENKHKQNQVEFDKKILQNMLERMKIDDVYYNLRQRSKQKLVKQKLILINKQQQHTNQLGNLQSKIGINLNELQFQFSRLQNVRSIQMYEAKNSINFQKRKRTQIQENKQPGIQDTHSRKMHLIHLMLQQILRSRILRLSQNYKNLESSYRKIRATTNINDFEDLLQKYFSQGSVCQKLTKEVLRLQKLQDDASVRNTKLQQQLRRLYANNITQRRSLKFVKIDHIPNEIDKKDYKMDMIESWVFDKSKKLKMNLNGLSPSQMLKQICRELSSSLAKNNSLTDQYFKKKFFNPGITLKRQPKILTIAEERSKLTQIAKLKEQNQMESQFLNRLRASIKKHNKSKTME